MELGHNHSHLQKTQPQLQVPCTNQIADSTIITPVFAYHHDPAPCINNNVVFEPVNEDYNINGNNFNIDDDHEAFFNSLPPGFRFRPTKEELIKNYLLPKIKGEVLPPSRIRDVNLYEDNPDRISERYESEEKEWYFFTPRDRKYPKGHRPRRAAGDGYWKATGADVKISDKKVVIGCKKSLVYFEGKPPNGEKTHWIMHEYIAHQEDSKKVPQENKTTTMRLDDYVLCKIYKKNDSKGNSREGFRQGGTPSTSTSVKNCNSQEINDAKEPADSSRLLMMNSQENTVLMDASTSTSSAQVNFSNNFPVKEVAPVNYLYDYGYGYGHEMFSSKQEFEDFSYFDSYLSLPHDPSNGSCQLPPSL